MGADQLKIMASGGVTSPTDPIGAFGYSEDEIRAIVAEARGRDTYASGAEGHNLGFTAKRFAEDPDFHLVHGEALGQARVRRVEPGRTIALLTA